MKISLVLLIGLTFSCNSVEKKDVEVELFELRIRNYVNKVAHHEPALIVLDLAISNNTDKAYYYDCVDKFLLMDAYHNLIVEVDVVSASHLIMGLKKDSVSVSMKLFDETIIEDLEKIRNGYVEVVYQNLICPDPNRWLPQFELDKMSEFPQFLTNMQIEISDKLKIEID